VGFTSSAGFNVLLSYNGLGAAYKTSSSIIQAETTEYTRIIPYHG